MLNFSSRCAHWGSNSAIHRNGLASHVACLIACQKKVSPKRLLRERRRALVRSICRVDFPCRYRGRIRRRAGSCRFQSVPDKWRWCAHCKNLLRRRRFWWNWLKLLCWRCMRYPRRRKGCRQPKRYLMIEPQRRAFIWAMICFVA